MLNQQRYFSPSIDDLKKRVESNDFLWILDRVLPIDWEFYYKPFLNGNSPDLVLLSPGRGIVIMQFCFNNIDFDNLLKRQSDKLSAIKREIRELYCPRIGGQYMYSNLKSILVFNKIKKEDIRLNELRKRKEFEGLKYHEGINTNDFLKQENLKKECPFLFQERRISKYFAQDMRNWLVDPDFSAVEQKPLEIKPNTKQNDVIKNKTGVRSRRITGPAGSGKSLVIAARAAELAILDKNVLIITYNITLINYLKGLFFRYLRFNLQSRIQTPKVTFIHYHGLCKRRLGHLEQYKEMWKLTKEDCNSDNEDSRMRSILDEKLPNLLIEKGDTCFSEIYDAILVDEGQDFIPIWWASLLKFKTDTGEALLCADNTQDIYDKSGSWTNLTLGLAGFSGTPMKFDISYRMPPRLTKHAADFATKFISLNLRDLPKSDKQYELYDCEMSWVQVSPNNLEIKAVEEIKNLALKIKDPKYSIPDTTVIVDDSAIGMKLVEKLESLKFSVAHTFDKEHERSRYLKETFFMSNATIKITTLHSFKGWETRALVMVIAHMNNKKKYPVFYSGMTRVKWHAHGSILVVVTSVPEIAEYGKTWGNK